jgi:hypothetical protein
MTSVITKSDNRVCDSRPERHDRSARNYPERDESVDAGVVTVREWVED